MLGKKIKRRKIKNQSSSDSPPKTAVFSLMWCSMRRMTKFNTGSVKQSLSRGNWCPCPGAAKSQRTHHTVPYTKNPTKGSWCLFKFNPNSCIKGNLWHHCFSAQQFIMKWDGVHSATTLTIPNTTFWASETWVNSRYLKLHLTQGCSDFDNHNVVWKLSKLTPS